jgi:hypothetical protein
MPNSIESNPKGSGEADQTKQQPAGLSQGTKLAVIGLLSRAQVAQRLNVCPHSVQCLTRRGLLPAIVFNWRLIRYDPEAVERYIRAAMIA